MYAPALAVVAIGRRRLPAVEFAGDTSAGFAGSHVNDRVCVFGAGSIGCLCRRPARCRRRARYADRARADRREIAEYGLHLTDWQGTRLDVASDGLRYATGPEAAADAGLVLITVKSADTDAAGTALASVLDVKTVVVSFQNGLGNAPQLKRHLTRQVVLAGMVPFNVVNRGRGAFHQGSEGTLEVERHSALAAFEPPFATAGLPLAQQSDLRAVHVGEATPESQQLRQCPVGPATEGAAVDA
jgi:2-dehydropantoate 2-reductase